MAPDLQLLASEFLRFLNKAIRSLRMYAPEHRQVQTDLQEAFAALNRMLTVEPQMVLGTRDGVMIVQNKPVREQTPILKGFCEMLSARHISSFTVQRGVTVAEFTHFVGLMGKKPDDIVENDRIQPALLQPLRSIKVNELRFVTVQEGVSDEQVAAAMSGGGGGGGGAAAQDNLARLLSLLVGEGTLPAGGPGPAPAEGGTVPAVGNISGADGMRALANMLGPVLATEAGGQAVESVSQSFDKVVERCFGSQSSLQFLREYIEGVNALPPQLQQAVFGAPIQDPAGKDLPALMNRVPLAFRGMLVARDLQERKVPIENLRSVMAELAPASDEFVQLMEFVSRNLIESGGSAEEGRKKLSDLFKLLPVAEEVKRLRGSVLVIDPDPANLAETTKALKEGGYIVAGYSDGKSAFAALRQKKTFDALVTDIKVPGMSGLEILAQLSMDPRPIPVAIVTSTRSFGQAFEVATYPKLRFLVRPVEPGSLVRVLDQIVPPRDKAQAPQAPKEDLERARDIQHNLMPSELPSIPGFEMAAHYKPAATIGGDYYDAMILPDGRVGVIVADVSGKNVSAAMVMVMTRTILRNVAPDCKSPRDTMIKANASLVGEMPRGMFITAFYGILDPTDGAFSMVSCGHTKPLLWNSAMGFLDTLDLPGMAMGIVSGPSFELALQEQSTQLSEGDHLLVFTDGVTEALNAKGEEFGDARLLKVMRGAATNSPDDLITGVLESVLLHRGVASASDDLTLLALRRLHGP